MVQDGKIKKMTRRAQHFIESILFVWKTLNQNEVVFYAYIEAYDSFYGSQSVSIGKRQSICRMMHRSETSVLAKAIDHQ